MTHDRVTATPAQAAAWERAHGPDRNDDAHARRDEAAEADFRSPDYDCGGCGTCLACICRRHYGGTE